MSQLEQQTIATKNDGNTIFSNRKFRGFLQHPTAFWFLTPSDRNLNSIINTGLLLSMLLLIGINSWLILFLLWLIHLSIVTITSVSGSSFYQYGWESQLLETGFLAIFLCDLPFLSMQETITDWKDKPLVLNRSWQLCALWKDYVPITVTTSKTRAVTTSTNEPSYVILYLMQWLIFRISMGAGLIKIRGSSCWTDKTCLWYHFETQPLPSPLSFIFHFLPKKMLSSAVDLDLCVQVYFVWLSLIPPLPSWNKKQKEQHHQQWTSKMGDIFLVVVKVLCWLRRIGGLIQISFMIMILLSGNFSILNHLTIVPALACLDDGMLDFFRMRRRLTPSLTSSGNRQQDTTTTTITTKTSPPTTNTTKLQPCRISFYTRWIVDISLLCLIGYLSIPVVTNLLQWKGKTQQMNASYDPFRLVNTYGAFGSVGTARYEPIISISYDDSGHAGSNTWYEIDLPCKPGKLTRRPCFCAPYHYRLDWNIWFIGFKPHRAYLYQREQWLFTLIEKMLKPESKGAYRPWLELLDGSASKYFLPHSKRNPKAVKVEMFHYMMRKPLWDLIRDNILGKDSGKVIWWSRKFEETLIPPVKWDPTRNQLVLI